VALLGLELRASYMLGRSFSLEITMTQKDKPTEEYKVSIISRFLSSPH
jgi:hypothetical protein